MIGKWRLLLATVAAFALGNAVCAALLSASDKSGNTSLAQSVTEFRDIYNLVAAVMFVAIVIIIISGRGSSAK